ncbi:intradiol ring-cleavage dioxygenase [Tropicibacter sp. S64]|uniref:intradiol ring-cleavage dioxygenase n=1 Tax=Tropicibacter sp. S64 TaxID=3415122 RepID=UPI003C7DD801
MTDYFTETGSAETVNARISPDADARLAAVMASLVRHLHAFVKDVTLTEAEWETAIAFLTRTGQMCSDTRQEFILLSDVLGVSMLVDAVNNRKPAGSTPSTVFGPFHVDGVPERKMGANISLDGVGEPCLFRGRVVDLEGRPIAGATVDVWSDNADGFYDVQQPDTQPQHNNRGIFVTGADGRYWFTGIKPVSYPIPDDGPVGEMLGHLGRHPWRPAHMHFLVSAPGYDRLITHTFVAGDDYLASDAVFGVKAPLIVDFARTDAGPEAGPETPLWQADYDFVLPPA